MTLDDIHCLMQELSKSRPIFHSEADFQHALAWQIHEAIPDSQIRLEYPFRHDDSTMYMDIWLPSERIAIELKYFTKQLELSRCGESFELREHSARDLARRYFLSDVQRLEQAVTDWKRCQAAFSILLTNDSLLWDPKRLTGRITNDYNFRLHEGKPPIGGELKWLRKGKECTELDQYAVCLSGTYNLQWKDYFSHATTAQGRFRYLAFEVQPTT